MALTPIEMKLLDGWKAEGKTKEQALVLLDKARAKLGLSGGSFMERASSVAQVAPTPTEATAEKAGLIKENMPEINQDIGEDSARKEMMAKAMTPGFLKPVGDTLNIAKEGYGNIKGGLFEQAKEMVGKDENKDVSGEGFTRAVQGAFQTAFSPVAAILQNTPGGDKVAEVLSMPRELVGDLWEIAWKKAGKDVSDPAFQQGKEQIMSGFDVGTLLVPTTKTGRSVATKGKDLAVSTGKSTTKLVGTPVAKLTGETFKKLTGLSDDTIKTIVDAPDQYKTVKDLGVDAAKQNLFTSVKTSIDDTRNALSETGQGYNSIRQSQSLAPVPTEYWASIADDLKIKPQVDSNGALMGFVSDSTSKLRSAADLQKLADTLRPYWGKSQMLPEEFLNYRSDLTNLSKFDAAKTTDLMTKAKNLRADANEKIGGSIEGLRGLDAEYKPQVEYVNKIEELIYDKQGNVKDNALSTLANLTGKGKEFKLERLEQIMPGVASDIKAIKALENVKLASQAQVGQYTRSGAVAYSFIKAMSGDLTGVPIAIALALTHPSIVAEFLRYFGETKAKLSASEVQGLVSKIEAGQKLTTSESSSISNLLQSIETADLVPLLSSQPVDEAAEE